MRFEVVSSLATKISAKSPLPKVSCHGTVIDVGAPAVAVPLRNELGTIVPFIATHALTVIFVPEGARLGQERSGSGRARGIQLPGDRRD